MNDKIDIGKVVKICKALLDGACADDGIEYDESWHENFTCRGCGSERADSPEVDHKPGCPVVEARKILKEFTDV